MKYSSFIIICILFQSIYTYSQDTIIKSGDLWRYFPNEHPSHEDWAKHEISDGTWLEGKTPFGDNKMIGTPIDCSLETKDGPIVSHFSKTVFIDNPFNKLAYEIRLKRDDGAIVYINGHEFWRSNVSDDILPENVIALEPVHSEEGETFIIKVFPPEDFRDGMNTIGVTLYTWGKESASCSFDLEFIEHNSLEAVPQLLRFIDEETDLLESKLEEMTFQEKLNNLESKYTFLEQVNHYNKIFLIISILLIIAGFLLWYKYRILQRQRVSDLKEMINKNREEKLNYLFNSLRVNQHFEQIRNDLMNLIGDKEITSKELKKIIQSINYIGDKEQDWVTMETEFNIVNANYLTRLKESYPTLSRTELRHCIFIKLHVPTKELAELMNIEPRSVEAARYRIKKKLKLSEKVDLIEFLFKF